MYTINLASGVLPFMGNGSQTRAVFGNLPNEIPQSNYYNYSDPTDMPGIRMPRSGVIKHARLQQITGTVAANEGFDDGRLFELFVLPDGDIYPSQYVATDRPNLVFLDNFVGADDTLLLNHAPDVRGDPWSLESGTWEIQSGAAVMSFGGAHNVLLTESNVSDVWVRASVTFITEKRSGFAFRGASTSSYLYVVGDEDANTIELWKNDAGVHTMLDSAAQVIGNNETWTIAVRALGQTVDVYFDGLLTPLFTTAAVSFNETATMHGLFCDGEPNTSNWALLHVLRLGDIDTHTDWNEDSILTIPFEVGDRVYASVLLLSDPDHADVSFAGTLFFTDNEEDAAEVDQDSATANAQSDATQALTDAAAAQADATQALSDAGQALSDAATAQGDATQALSDAATAQGTADDHIADVTDAHDASAISIADAADDFIATDVEGALAELQSESGEAQAAQIAALELRALRTDERVYLTLEPAEAVGRLPYEG